MAGISLRDYQLDAVDRMKMAAFSVVELAVANPEQLWLTTTSKMAVSSAQRIIFGCQICQKTCTSSPRREKETL